MEIPKEMSDRMKVDTNEENNPIKQDLMKGRPWKYMYVISFNSILCQINSFLGGH